MKLPKMMLEKLDPAEVFRSLHIVDTTNVGLPTNYHILTPEQKAYVDEIVNICESKFQHQIAEYNDSLYDVEVAMLDKITEIQCDIDDLKYKTEELHDYEYTEE